MEIELTVEDVKTLEEIYIDLYADYKVRTVSADILKVEDPTLERLKRQVEVLEKFLFKRSPRA